ncbi:MAG: histidine kinase, partial [Flavobacteriaceae bacterium]
KFIHLKNTVLQLQMNPHFIFNSLTAIQNSVLKKDNLKSAELIATFSKLIRQNLDYSNRKTISLTEEIDMLSNYIETQQFRFDNLFTYDIILDPKIKSDDVRIPPMLIQPFIENAIEHGLKHKEKGGKIVVKIKKNNKGIRISIEDNGIGFESSKKYTISNKDGKIHAIDIFKDRLKIRKKQEEKSFALSNLTQNDKVIGTKVSFTLKE